MNKFNLQNKPINEYYIMDKNTISRTFLTVKFSNNLNILNNKIIYHT